jgi:flagellin
MSLGVLNNLSAMSAANNLNNTNNSLSKTLQQLSSGSKINSGSDDAAGLSLINGLQANSTALAQSQTNAQEGVGLLQVADGALSQVTNLLNRAVTLATEVSNGTLNTSQQSAANQEYQSILSEINNIGSTTTYNQRQVFGSTTNIYTGDSSTTGASINSLNIRSLSSSNVGDANGAMSYTTGAGQNAVWIDMGSTTAGLGDFLDAAGPGTTGSITVTSLTSSGGTATTTISTGGATGYTNTVGGLISAINNSGLGLTASLSTGAVAGQGSASTNKGIMITGSVGLGTAPSTSSYSGSFTAGVTTDSLTGSITITEGSGAATTISMTDVAKATGGSALSNLETYLAANGSLGVTANGTTTLGLASTNGSSPLTVSSSLFDTTQGKNLTYTAQAAYSEGISANTAFDVTNGQASAAAAAAGTVTSSGGVATIGYSDLAGTNLGSSDLTSQTNAQAALTSLNSAITAVAAQDGYIGAQINTLNAVSSVMSTQQQNIVAAQNAVQATDYATAASNMSKYQILSQTGISALAQANSVQQEVLKLLQ